MAESKRPVLDVEPRAERGSRANRRLRREGLVPGVVYGGKGEPEAFKVGERELWRVLHSGAAALIDVKIDGKTRPVVVKDQQLHPVRGEVTHLDLLEVRLDEKIHAPVALELEGAELAPGVEEGGVLSHVTREVTIEALPTDIPELIVADVSGLEINATLTLESVTPPAGVSFVDDPAEIVVATITPPTKVEEPEPEVEEEAELVGEEGEAPAEGEEARESEGSAAPEGEGGGDSSGGDAGGDES